jgi:multiple sugar transport system permease protein
MTLMKTLGLRRQDIFGYALILPAMLIVLGFIVYPVGDVIRLSFTNTSLLTHKSDFVWFQSYEKVLADPLIGTVLQNTAIWVFATSILVLIIGLAIGYFISFDFSINKALRSGILVPWILPAIVSIAAWKWMYNAELGVLNDLLIKAGIISEGYPWLGETNTVIFALVVVAVWRHLPFAALVISAAVQAIPNTTLEAATIDGANGWDKFRLVVMPNLGYTLSIVGVLQLIWNMNDLLTVWGSTKGGPAGASEILSTFIYDQGFMSFRFGVSSAASVMNFLVILVASLIYLLLLKDTWRADEA